MLINIRVLQHVQLVHQVVLQLHAVIQDLIVIPFTLFRHVMWEQAQLQQALHVKIAVFVFIYLLKS